MPGHGTVPAALTDIEWEDWDAATRLAVREARRRVGPSRPLHIVGFSNGGALAVKYALDAIDDQRLARPDRLILISPMIGITAFARFVGHRRPAGDVSRLRQGGVARHRARVQSLQVQFVPGQRRAPVAPPDGRAAGSPGNGAARRASSTACRRS